MKGKIMRKALHFGKCKVHLLYKLDGDNEFVSEMIISLKESEEFKLGEIVEVKLVRN